MGMGSRMTWLALVSMLVCAVGIANAMLMSVTERFREIATLKCLGALDGFIMNVFLIEAAILGFVGGVGGTVIGLGLGVLRTSILFKSLLFTAFPGGDLLAAALLSIGIGVLLAAVAAGDHEAAEASYKAAVPVIDAMVNKGILHANKAARHKSRLNAKVQALQA